MSVPVLVGKRIDWDGTFPPDGSWEYEPGEYVLLEYKGHKEVWFTDPIGHHGRAIEPTWGITENEDGTVTIEGSLRVGAGREDKPEWHGYLRNGTFETI